MTDVVAGRFALCDPIARGGSGVVWRAYDRKQQQFCAAKVLRRRDAGDLLRFVREQSVRMSHRHVLTPYSWAAEDAHVVIASELVDGGSLTTLLGDHGPLAESTVATVLDQLLLALEQVHDAGLVHRDVKPANLLLRATGTGPIEVLLGDFGLAVGADDAPLTQAGTVVGTPGYLAPEILRGGVRPGPRHDLYAAGRVAAALAAGVEPTGIGNPTDLGGFAPGPLRDVVARLSALAADDRPVSAAAARAQLHAALAGRPYDAVPRTRDGDAVDVVHQLPPLSDVALAETGRADTAPLRPGRFDAGAPTINPDVTGLAPRTGRRRWLLGAAGVAAAAAVTVPLVAAVAGTDADPAPRTRPALPTQTSGGSYTPPAVTAGQRCSFTDQGNVSSGLQCRLRADGDYVWTRR